MDSTVKSRPNHYEVLGLTPAATGDEIAKAFARQLDPLRPRPFGSLAEVTVAFETLRDRTRREAYDIALGLKPQLANPPPPREWASYSMRATARPAVRPAIDPAPRLAPKAEAPPRPEPELPPFVLASPPEPVEPDTGEDDPKPAPAAQELRPPEPAPRPVGDPQSGEGRLHFAESGRFQIGDKLPAQWKLPALAAGVLVFAVGIGAWTGLEAGNDDEQAQSGQAATLKIPPAKPLPAAAVTALPDATVPSVAEVQPEQPTPPAPANEVARSRQPLQITLPEEQPLVAQTEDVAVEQAVAEAAPIQAAATKMPLPNAVIARTIGRIGYPCGQVAATAAMGGAGVFKVTCTSGHSYRAAPVRGRYRFRRM